MAVVAGTNTTFASVGLREDLEDIIYQISPLETPFQSRASRGKANATFHEWQTDALAAAGKNAAIQGDDASYTTAAPTTRLRNYCQIMQKTAIVSGTQEAVDKAGRDSEMAYQMAQRSKELKRDLEYALIRNQASTAGAYGATAQLASVESWIATNKTSLGTGSTNQSTPGYSGGTVASPTDASLGGTLTEASLKAVISAVWTAGGDPKLIMVGPRTKQKISGAFNGIATRYRTVGQGQADIISGVDLYVSDFGEHQIVPNRFMRDTGVAGANTDGLGVALCLDMEYWEIAWLRGWQSWDLAKTGDAMKKQILGEVTLVSKQEQASGKVTDINALL